MLQMPLQRSYRKREFQLGIEIEFTHE